MLQRIPQRQQDAIGIERFFEEIIRAELRGFDGGLDSAVAGDHHDLCLRIELADLLERLEPVHPFHLDVEKDEVRLELGIDADRLVAGRARLDFDLLVFQNLLQCFANPLLVIHDHDATGTHGDLRARL